MKKKYAFKVKCVNKKETEQIPAQPIYTRDDFKTRKPFNRTQRISFKRTLTKPISTNQSTVLFGNFN